MLKVHKVLVVAWPDLFVFVSLSLPLSLCLCIFVKHIVFDGMFVFLHVWVGASERVMSIHISSPFICPT